MQFNHRWTQMNTDEDRANKSPEGALIGSLEGERKPLYGKMAQPVLIRVHLLSVVSIE